MKKQRLYLVSLCAVTALLAGSCSSESNGKYSCTNVNQCVANLGGEAYYWRCNVEYERCEAQIPEHCFNGAIDSGLETGKDCGGVCITESKLVDSSAFRCDNSVTCTTDDDCKSGSCVNKVCTQKSCETSLDCVNGGACLSDESGNRVCVSCEDGQKNQNETDVDCGGGCNKCESGKACKVGSDCQKGVCENGICSNVELKTADPNVLVINEVLDSGAKSPAFSLNGWTAACEFIEIANPSAETVSLEGLTLVLARTDDGKGSSISIPLDGVKVLPSKTLLVVHACDSLNVPAGALEMNAKIDMKGTGTYDIYLKAGETQGPVYSLTIGSTVNSSFVRDPEFNNASEMKKTIDVADHAEFATPGYCTNGGKYNEDCKVVTTCNNNVKDGNETDIDCGGTCAKCAIGSACGTDGDCASGKCDGNLCVDKSCANDKECGDGFVCDLNSGKCKQKESCSDNIKNQDETDVDCGGSCSQCAVGKICKVASDCVSSECTGGVCAGTAPAGADPSKLIINEVFDSSTASPVFSLNGGVKACEFVEIANSTSDTVSLEGINLVLSRTDDGKGTVVSIPLTGSLPGKNLLVVNNCETIELPTGAVNKTLSTTELKIVSTATYDIYLESGENKGPVYSLNINRVNNSSYVRDPEFNNGSEMKKTTEVAGAAAFATPGYCTNGGIYSEDCKVSCGNGNETCGGICAKCENGKSCTKPEDCASGECTGNVCTGTAITGAQKGDIIINEVMAAEDITQNSKSFFTYNDNGKECKFIEILNISGKKVNVDGCSVVLERRDDASKSNTTKLTGALDAKGVIVASYCDKSKVPDGIKLPEEVVSISMSNTNITQTASYNAYIKCADWEGTHILVDVATKGTSMNQPVDGVEAENLVKHSDVATNTEKVVASPGYCANGGKFSEDCKVSSKPSKPKKCDINNNNTDCDPGYFCAGETEDAMYCLPSCKTDSDCTGDAVCYFESYCSSCSDGVQAGNEADVDCGDMNGLCQKCGTGKTCLTNEDCQSNVCEGEGWDRICQ